MAPRHFIQIGASLFATGLVVAYVVSRLRSGVRRPQTLADRHTVIFALILAGNASICYVYTKDEIMSVAGGFYALPVFGPPCTSFAVAWTDTARGRQRRRCAHCSSPGRLRGQSGRWVCITCYAPRRSCSAMTGHASAGVASRWQLGALCLVAAVDSEPSSAGDFDAGRQSVFRTSMDGTCLRHQLLTSTHP